ncbi:site-specific DNA-methyltransferase [Moraxella atlantae]|uniref:site-specific DNA-methyltransferase n=1 Tax=Faucicola atlantae TaxID=34059 RepID=UPI003751D49B
MTTLKMHTPNLVDSNIDRIAELFPNCITEKPKTDEQGNVLKDANGEVILERGIDFELLKQELSHSVIDGSQERYRLDWVGKREAIVTANSPIAKTLRPCRAESVNFDTTGNLFIEGDNLEALKLLQESYLGKVKMIYIDPPYNTGNDFIYNDDFAADTAEFFERSGQVDADGNRLVANTERNGRFHSDWLSMMYSRLKLARNLLADDGVIFISIDDNEQANLKKICDEVFGIDNFLGEISYITNPGGRDYKQIAVSHEYLIIYSKSEKSELNELTKDVDFNLVDSSGGYELRELRNRNPKFHRQNRPNLFYPFYINPNSLDENGCCAVSLEKDEKFYVETVPLNSLGKESVWRWGKDKSKNNIAINDVDKSQVVARQKRDGGWNIYEKNRKSTTKAKSVWDETEMRNENGTRLLRILFEDSYFDHPKSLELLVKILSLGSITDGNDLVLDFFAGSSTTAHAVMQLNAEDGGNRQFIMVQIPEPTDPKSEAHKAGYPTIAEISKERIRRAGAKIKADNADKEGINELDTGFRVLKIDTTNMNDIYYRPQDYTQDLINQLQDNIKPDRTDEDLLFQFMLDTGVPLSLPIERTQINGHTIYQVGGNSLIASLDYIDANMVNDIAALNPLKFITSERAIATDSDKTNIVERFKQLSPHTDVRFI